MPEPRASALRVDRVSIVIPVYNSEGTIGALVDRCIAELAPRYASLQLVLVNDGSRDGSHDAVLAAQARHPGLVRYVRLARNFGEHNAVMCGLRHADGDAVAIIDDDLQNPPEEIARLVDELARGYDVVYSYYQVKRHGLLRNLGSSFNDRVATLLLGKPRSLYLSSFKALSAFLVRTVVAYQGPFPYLDGLVLRSTDNIGQLLCQHDARAAGRSNYTLARLVRLWLAMFTGFSIAPLRVAAVLGLVTSVLGVLLSLLFVLAYFLEGWLTATPVPPGWASLIVCVTVFSGLQLCVLGLLGEYLGRVLMTQNQAPQFIVREVHEPGSAATGASPLEAPAAAAPAAEAPAAEAPAAEVPAAEVPA